MPCGRAANSAPPNDRDSPCLSGSRAGRAPRAARPCAIAREPPRTRDSRSARPGTVLPFRRPSPPPRAGLPGGGRRRNSRPRPRQRAATRRAPAASPSRVESAAFAPVAPMGDGGVRGRHVQRCGFRGVHRECGKLRSGNQGTGALPPRSALLCRPLPRPAPAN